MSFELIYALLFWFLRLFVCLFVFVSLFISLFSFFLPFFLSILFLNESSFSPKDAWLDQKEVIINGCCENEPYRLILKEQIDHL